MGAKEDRSCTWLHKKAISHPIRAAVTVSHTSKLPQNRALFPSVMNIECAVLRQQQHPCLLRMHRVDPSLTMLPELLWARFISTLFLVEDYTPDVLVLGMLIQYFSSGSWQRLDSTYSHSVSSQIKSSWLKPLNAVQPFHSCWMGWPGAAAKGDESVLQNKRAGPEAKHYRGLHQSIKQSIILPFSFPEGLSGTTAPGDLLWCPSPLGLHCSQLHILPAPIYIKICRNFQSIQSTYKFL